MISLNYDPYALTFSNSRKDLKWQEIEYFLKKIALKSEKNVLDVGCGNGRLLTLATEQKVLFNSYLGIDSSEILLGEAKTLHPSSDFLLLDMTDLSSLSGKKYTDIFLIASFHHLETIEKREKVLEDLFEMLEEGGNIYMTNWALESSINYMKYMNNEIPGTENEYGSKDFKIKIGDFDRYYHSFNLSELEVLSEKAGFAIEENREFENKKNIITILKKV